MKQSMKKILLSLTLAGLPFFLQANQQNKFVGATDKIPNFGGLTTDIDGTLLICGYNHNVRRFHPKTREFDGSVFVLPKENFSFPNDVAIIPADPSRDIHERLIACTSFTDGRLDVVNSTTVIQANLGQFVTATITGPVNVFTFNPTLAFNPELGINGIQGCQPIVYDKVRDRLFTQSGFDASQLFMLNWRSSVPISIPLVDATLTPTFVALNSFEFGSDGQLYSPDFIGKQIVKINVDTGVVTPVVTGIPNPIALVIDSHGILYFISRSTGEVFTYNPTTNTTTVLATLEAALSDITFNRSQTKLFITNDQSTIYKVKISTGAVNIIFQSPVVGPWDIAFDSTTTSLYVADNGSLRKFNATTAALQDKLTLDSSANPLYNGFGLVCGVSFDADTITLSDITQGGVLVVNHDFSFHDLFSPFDPNHPELFPVLFGKQTFSAVRVLGGPVGEYYLVTNPVDGLITKLYPTASGLNPETFFSNLKAPVKLKIYKGFVYVVEAGEVFTETPNTGQVSRIPLIANPTPADQQILVDHLNLPTGLDILNDKMVILETNNSKLLQASALVPSVPVVLKRNLKMRNEDLIYQFAPVNIHTFPGVALCPWGVFFSETKLYQVSFSALSI